MQRTVAAALACALLLLAVPAGATSGGFAALAPGGVSPDRVDLTVDVAENGSATWTVTYRLALATENETAAFEDLQRDVRANRSAYLDPFAERIRTTVRTAENATGRPMNATAFSVSTRVQSIGSQYGVVAYQFTWHGFAAVDGRTVRAGDAIAGFYLDEDTTLTLSAPEDYRVASVSPPPTTRSENAVGWEGPVTFTDEQPRATFAPPAPSVPWPLVAGGVALLAALAGAGLWYRRRTRTGGASGSDDAGVETSDTTAGRPGESSGPDAAASDAEPDTDAGERERGDAAERPPAELLSNEERVKRVLRERGGRARQQEVVAETGWTEAKTSQVVSGMRESGDLESFRIGRENVLKLPDVDEGVEES
ncbi:hypothetical protein EFA46_007130 [Halarchaeum sp. CBA1220]|uniref:DUF7345 domain-containing protein n=1 Tax=Halarchaeum sp. CBA1220 TaxID=1853682 RepID=UPI000F3A9C5A|nr:DUF4897 domain-containing protein [Halarchaeum sp. CBA1220]QLC33984.1 hypothetical protein EFA46_007130 [Halarchaeum sp. CBA1220]